MGVLICDVGPRDGLQNEPEVLPPETRAELVDRLAAAGLRRIEAVSFVRADRVPQMAAAEDVIERVGRREAIELSGLVLNERGWERFAAAGLDRVNVTFAATETFNLRNGNATLAEAIERAEAILDAAGQTPTTVTRSWPCRVGWRRCSAARSRATSLAPAPGHREKDPLGGVGRPDADRARRHCCDRDVLALSAHRALPRPPQRHRRRRLRAGA